MKKNKISIVLIVSSILGGGGYFINKILGKKRKRTENIGHKQGLYEKYIKRPQDFLCASIALIVLSPIMLITAILVRVKLGSPIIFKQERPGLNGEVFTLYKFRTMTDKKNENGELLPDDVRLTKFGKLLRATSLDELPELINIINGDSGIIGTTKKNLDFTRVSLA